MRKFLGDFAFGFGCSIAVGLLLFAVAGVVLFLLHVLGSVMISAPFLLVVGVAVVAGLVYAADRTNRV